MSASAPAFLRYVGIDYSGAETPNASLKGLRVYAADREARGQVLPLAKRGVRSCLLMTAMAKELQLSVSRISRLITAAEAVGGGSGARGKT